ncbi:MAG: hypothetical protein ABL931_10100, partial [Usitatibacteraceae bacterium]
MTALLFSKPTVITLAVIGGLLSLIAIVLRKRAASQVWARRSDAASYVFMGASVLLFILIGLS